MAARADDQELVVALEAGGVPLDLVRRHVAGALGVRAAKLGRGAHVDELRPPPGPAESLPHVHVGHGDARRAAAKWPHCRVVAARRGRRTGLRRGRS